MSPETNQAKSAINSQVDNAKPVDALTAFKETYRLNELLQERLTHMTPKTNELIKILLADPDSCKTYEKIVELDPLREACENNTDIAVPFMHIINFIHWQHDNPEFHGIVQANEEK